MFAQICHCLVISAPPVARPLYYSPSPVSVDPSTCGNVSPARKAASVLEPSPGIKHKECGSTCASCVALLHEGRMESC